MIVSDSFIRSQKARDSDFTTNIGNSEFTTVKITLILYFVTFAQVILYTCRLQTVVYHTVAIVQKRSYTEQGSSRD